ncbi:PQQ-binding-like beta-propeller repeat protein [Thermoproteota archaeon]
MQISINKTKITAIFVITILITSVFLLMMPTIVQAELAAKQPYSGPLKSGDVADGTFDTDVWISIRPNVIGVNQPVLINAWATPASNAQRRLHDFHIIINKPDGTTDEYTLDTEIDTAATWMEYLPDQVGEYTYKVDFPGTFHPAGYYNNGEIFTEASEAGSGYRNRPTEYTGSTYYKPDTSPEYTFTVQEDMVFSWSPVMQAPTDYWERPVAPEHREWLPIIGDFPWYGPAGPDYYQRYPDCSPYWNRRMDFYPYVQGPSSAHYAWKLEQNIAGITGIGRYGDYGTRGWSYTVPHSTRSSTPSSITMVIGGRGYMTVPKVISQIVDGEVETVSTTALQCVDIRTGELLWEVDGFSHSQSQSSFGTWQFRGAIEYPSMDIVYLDGDRLYKYDENSGRQTVDVSIEPLTSAIHYMNGHGLGVQNLGNDVPRDQRYRLINFTTTGSTSNFASRVVSNISWPLSSLPSTTDFTLGIAASFGRGLIGFSGTTSEQRLVTVNLYTGQVIVNKTIAPAGAGNLMGYSGASDVCDKGIYAFLTAWGTFVGLDIRTGDIRWTTPKMDEPWDANGFGAYDTTSAYGMFYRAAYSGIYAFDWDTGDIVWKYEAPAITSFESPYITPDGTTIYSFNGEIWAADGKIYSVNTEHTATQPYTRGWQLHCVDAKTGEGIFKTMMGGARMTAIADGYLALRDSYTGTVAVLGKGKSATTVTAPDVAVSKGTALTIKGTVLDLSPAQPGTPCVSKESMALQMEYLHRQMPIGGLWGNETITGVPVALTAMESEGSYIDIGVVTTEGYYGTFSKAWTPPEEGDYTIIASFAGDESYGSSGAATAVTVGPAVEPSGPIEPEPIVEPLITTEVAIIAAVAVAAVIGVVAYWGLKKRK